MQKKSVTANDNTYVSPSALALLKHQCEILKTWESEVRDEIAAAATLSQPVLVDTLPLFITNLAQALDESHVRSIATESSNVAQEHGGERARVTNFGPEQILTEYRVLRRVIERSLAEHNALSVLDRETIQKSFDLAVQEAMMAFFAVHTALRDQFIATLSHDLRNPIGAAKLSAELILRSLSEPIESPEALEELRDLAQRIMKNLQRGDRLIQGLLDTNTVQVGDRLHLQIEEGDLGKLVRSIIDEMAEQDRARVRLEGASVVIHSDLELLRRAIENLISNAIKYGASGTPVCIRVSEVLRRALVSVHNEGDPIPLEEQGRLFQTLHRTTSARTSGKKGWGLGLTFVRGVCESHSGSIGIESAHDKGTTFTIDIPMDARPFQAGI